jgi:hypothetical protein
MLGGRRKYLPRNHEKEQLGIKWENPSNFAPGDPDVSSQKTVNDGGKRCERACPTTGWHLDSNLVSRAFRDCARIAAHAEVIDMPDKRAAMKIEFGGRMSWASCNLLL